MSTLSSTPLSESMKPQPLGHLRLRPKKKKKKKPSALCLMPSPDSPLLVKREDGRRCAFLKNPKQPIWAPRGKQGAAELARSAHPTGGMSPSLIACQTEAWQRLGGAADGEVYQRHRSWGRGVRAAPTLDGRRSGPKGRKGLPCPSPLPSHLRRETDEARERGRETRRTAGEHPAPLWAGQTPAAWAQPDTSASRVPASEPPAPHNPPHTECLHVTGPLGSLQPQPRALDNLTPRPPDLTRPHPATQASLRFLFRRSFCTPGFLRTTGSLEALIQASAPEAFPMACTKARLLPFLLHVCPHLDVSDFLRSPSLVTDE